LNFFEQGPLKIFQAESAQIFFIRVRPEKIEQGLHENPESPSSMVHHTGFPLIQIHLTFGRQSLLNFFRAGAAQKFLTRVRLIRISKSIAIVIALKVF